MNEEKEHFVIEFYKTTESDCPVREFLDLLDYKMRAKALRMIMLLEEHGNELRQPYSKALDDGIFELRAKQGSDIIRILYFFIIGRKIILTNGFIKKTQKTPAKEIETAKQYRKEYLSRKER